MEFSIVNEGRAFDVRCDRVTVDIATKETVITDGHIERDLELVIKATGDLKVSDIRFIP